MQTRSEGNQSGSVSVAITNTPVAGENRNRLEITLVNDGANIIYLQLQTVAGSLPVAVAGKGIRLNANGGSWTSTRFTGAVNAIALTGTTNLTIAEV